MKEESSSVPGRTFGLKSLAVINLWSTLKDFPSGWDKAWEQKEYISLLNLRRDIRRTFRKKWMGTVTKDTADFMKWGVSGTNDAK